MPTVGDVPAFKNTKFDPTKTYWMGPVPTTCDLSGTPITSEFVDGRMKRGAWCNMHPDAHRIYGVGCGTGKGQRYKKQADGRWLKVEG